MAQGPIQAILGVQNAANPFEVLGLPVRAIAEADVVDALGRRMRQVSEHPLSETPEGNEVRLALHAAAAQLLDAKVRRALLDRAGVSAEPVRNQPRSTSGVLGPQALLVIASEGGWNPRALRRLAMLAHAEGIPSHAIPDAVRRVAGAASLPMPAPPDERRGRATRQLPKSEDRDGIGTVITAACALAGIIVIGVTWLALQHRMSPEPVPTTATPAATPPDEQAASVLDDNGASEAQSENPPTAAPIVGREEPDWAAALLGLRDAGESIDADTAAQILDGIAMGWTSTNDRTRSSTVSAVVDIMYQMPAAQGSRLVERMARGIRSDNAAVASWYAGVLSRLSIERSLPTEIDNGIVAALVSTIGADQSAGDDAFLRGAAAGLGYVARSWPSTAPGDRQLGPWLAAADAVKRSDAVVGDAAIADALQQLVRGGTDPLSSADSMRAIGELAARLEPASNARAAGVVLALLGDPGVPTRALSAVVNAFARSGDPAIPRLAPAASDAERAEVRETLARLWLGENANELTTLADQVRTHLESDLPAGPAGLIGDAVLSARLANVCRIVLWGSDQGVEPLLSGIDADVTSILGAAASRTSSLKTGAGEDWAVRYLEARRNIPVRLSLLAELVDRSGPLGPVAAEIVVSEAISGSPARVRREAQDVVRLHTGQASFVQAVLEQLPVAPRVRSVQELVESAAATPLPPIEDPDWPMAARRAVVNRLLSLLTSDSADAKIDELAGLLAVELAEMADAPASPDDDPLRAAARLVDLRLETIRRTDLSGASAQSAAEVSRLLSGRRALSRGHVQRFAAEQVSAVELLAEIVRLERPDSVREVDRIMTDLERTRARAESVFEQIASVERASLGLWALRVGVSP